MNESRTTGPAPIRWDSRWRRWADRFYRFAIQRRPDKDRQLRHPLDKPPALSTPEFLVFSQCSCGWLAACPEGYRWPLCPRCGEQVLPPKVASERTAYTARRLGEQEALRLTRTLQEANDPDATGELF